MSQNNRSKLSNKKYHSRKSSFGKAKKEVPKDKDLKGFWEYSFLQKKVKPTEESNIKKKLRILGGYNPSRTVDYINPPLSKEEVIQKKLDNGENINSKEKIIINSYNEKLEKALAKDLESLSKFSLNANVTTDEGRKRKLIKSLEYVIKKGDKNMTCLIYLKLQDKSFTLSDSLRTEFLQILNKMKTIVADSDLIKLQMTELHSSQPPLDQKGFTKLDDFQIEVINNVNNNKSTIVSAPTSSGKSVISGYTFTKGKTLVIVPTDVLAWQMASYIGEILKADIPIITKSFQSNPKRDELIKQVNLSNALVGTADSILDYLPSINIKFDWIVFDEIHMIGREEGSSMEHIAKVYNEIPFLALSATIGNVEELRDWFQSLGDKSVSIVKCDKRFFNLQRYIYLNEMNNIERLHPLGMVSIDSIKDGTILSMNLQPTPPDIWDLAMKLLENNLELDEINPYNYFQDTQRITLDNSNEYFNKLIEFMVNVYEEKSKEITKIMGEYHKSSVKTENIDVFQMLMKLKEAKKCPAIVFQENSTSCMRIVRQLAKQIETTENEKYPSLFAEREKKNKIARKLEKENEKKKIDDLGDNKRHKMMMSTTSNNLEEPEFVSMQEPHKDFIFNEDQFFTAALVEEWVKNLKGYFPNSGDEYHWLIVMLWRGVGVYVKGLPDSYLRLVQMLASTKKLAVVFSDTSLVFGVSMPFRTTVILRDVLTEDSLDSMMYHQMAGRAGRRGLDKEGNVIFAGYSWSRIKELSISSFPIIRGTDTMIWSPNSANEISRKQGVDLNWNKLKSNFIHPDISNDSANEFYQDIDENMGSDGGWDFMSNTEDKTINHNFLIWRLRHDMDCITVPMFLPEFKKLFEFSDPNKEKDQINIALFLSHFINLKESTDENYVLPECLFLSDDTVNRLKSYAENLGIEIPEKIDSKVYQSILYNKLVDNGNESDIDELRDNLFKFSEKIKHIQHYFFHTKQVTVARTVGKLLTRIWWIYHTSSPLMKSWKVYEDFNTEYLLSEYEDEEISDEDYEEFSPEDDINV
jgi:hypothetical protein